MRPEDLADLQAGVLEAFGEPVEVLDGPGGVAVWTGEAAVPADVDVVGPDAELGRVDVLNRLSFVRVGAPDLPIETRN